MYLYMNAFGNVDYPPYTSLWQHLGEQMVQEVKSAGLTASLTDLATTDPEQCLTQQVLCMYMYMYMPTFLYTNTSSLAFLHVQCTRI